MPPLPQQILTVIGNDRATPVAAALIGNRTVAADLGHQDRWHPPFGHRGARTAAAQLAVQCARRQPHSTPGRMLKTWRYAGHYCTARARIGQYGEALVICWNGFKSHHALVVSAARDLGLPILYLEESPFPGRLSLDFTGINAGNSLPRRAEFYLDWRRESNAPVLWRGECSRLEARASCQSQVHQKQGTLDTGGEKTIFVPLQVPGDTQVRLFGGWVGSVERMIDLLAEASAALPEGWHMRVKEHPSSLVLHTDRLRQLETAKFRLDNTSDTFEQVAASSLVLTLNSSVGVQAFLHEKPVAVMGEAFWDFDGAAHRVPDRAALLELMRAPDRAGFDPEVRSAFLDFCLAEYFPKEEAILSGAYGLDDVVARDLRIAARLAKLSSAAAPASGAGR